LCRGLFGCGESEGNLSTEGSAEETVQSEASRTKVPSIEQICLEFGDQRRRVAFCQVLRGEILLREPPHTELENASPILLASAAFEVLTAMVYAALDACSEKNDIWCGRDLVVLVHLFNTKLENSKVVCLLERVYRHPLWNKVNFWENLLLIGLCEAHAAESIFRRNIAAGCQFVEPAMTSFLQKFTSYLKNFGISFEQTRVSILSVLQKNAQLIGGQNRAYASLLLHPFEPQPCINAAGNDVDPLGGSVGGVSTGLDSFEIESDTIGSQEQTPRSEVTPRDPPIESESQATEESLQVAEECQLIANEVFS